MSRYEQAVEAYLRGRGHLAANETLRSFSVEATEDTSCPCCSAGIVVYLDCWIDRPHDRPRLLTTEVASGGSLDTFLTRLFEALEAEVPA